MSLSPFTRHFPFGRITSIANYRVCSLHSTVTLTKSISSMSSVSPQRSSQLLFPPPPERTFPPHVALLSFYLRLFLLQIPLSLMLLNILPALFLIICSPS